MLKWLRGLGQVGAFAANALQFLFLTYPGLTMSALLTAFLAYFTSALLWVQDPRVYSFASIFLFVLWTYIGIITLRSKNTPQMVRVVHDYAYGLILDGGWQPTFGKFPNNHPTNPGGEAITITCNFRNVSGGPLRQKIEEFRVVLNNRTNDDSGFGNNQIFAKLAQMGIRCGGIPRSINEFHLSGTLNLKFLYGHPDESYARRYTLKLNIQIAIDPATQLATINDDGIEIIDEPYVNNSTSLL